MSAIEDLLAFHIRAYGLPEPEREARLVADRKFRWDFLFRAQRIAVEVQGGIWTKSRKSGHTTGAGISRDCEKANLAALAGFRTLFFTSSMVRSGEAARLLQRALLSG